MVIWIILTLAIVISYTAMARSMSKKQSDMRDSDADKDSKKVTLIGFGGFLFQCIKR